MSYTELITLLVAIIGALAAVYSIRLVVQTFKADHERRKKQATIEYAGQILREARFKLDSRYGPRSLTNEEFAILMNTPADYAEWRHALGVFEHLAVGVNAGVYDKDILYRMSGSYIIELFSLVQPYVQSKREKFHFAYEEFERLAKEFEDRHQNRGLVWSAGDIKHSR